MVLSIRACSMCMCALTRVAHVNEGVPAVLGSWSGDTPWPWRDGTLWTHHGSLVGPPLFVLGYEHHVCPHASWTTSASRKAESMALMPRTRVPAAHISAATPKNDVTFSQHNNKPAHLLRTLAQLLPHDAHLLREMLTKVAFRLSNLLKNLSVAIFHL